MGKIEITGQAELQALIQQCEYAVLSMSDNGQPYAVPLNVAYDGEYIYLHSGHTGRKLDILQNNPKVYLSFISEAVVVQRNKKSACGVSMNFKSVAVSGTAEVFGKDSDLESRRAGILCLIRRFGVEELPIDERVLAATALIRVKPEFISGRCKSGQPG